MKLISKERQGSTVVKKYDQAKMPRQRVLVSSEVSEVTKKALREQFHRLDPVQLLAKLERLQDRFWQYAHKPAGDVDGGAPASETHAPTPSAASIGSLVVAQGQSFAGGDGACHPVTVATPRLTQKSQPHVSKSARRCRKTRRKPKRTGRYHLVKHTWRTRPDPFVEVWQGVEAQLKKEPHLEAKRLFLGL